MFPSSVKVFIVLLIFLGGCTELTTEEVSVVAIEDELVIEDENVIDDSNKIFNKIGN